MPFNMPLKFMKNESTMPEAIELPSQPALLTAYYAITCVVIARSCCQLYHSTKALGYRRSAIVFLLGVAGFLLDASAHIKYFAPPGDTYETLSLMEWGAFFLINPVLVAFAFVGRDLDCKSALAVVFVPFASILPFLPLPQSMSVHGHDMPTLFPTTHEEHAMIEKPFHWQQLLIHSVWTIGFMLLSSHVQGVLAGEKKHVSSHVQGVLAGEKKHA